ncbi:MerR family transcriptional regulator [Planctomonas sp. JC2975]|uniref:MerR family transcriptional regulator n=1 Tax=Planctomonas sp. JC2975 TaxID=2729626 RepID=UPI00147488A7|nr:MerR family transcriptional regulator [Planctomonas sp. JC2975]NNC12198.1 MerR family transcriptional regulator [Planctomonas sp. JC2975]
MISTREGRRSRSSLGRHPDARIVDVAHTLVSIGDFSRMTHLTVKALRYYHDVGVLEPADIDPDSGYRRYSTEQVPVAQVVRRLRDLDMPIDAVREVVSAPDVEARNAAIADHLSRMEDQLAQTRSAVASLRSLLQPVKRGEREIEFRSTAPMQALAISARTSLADALAFVAGAVTEILATGKELGLGEPGVPGALFFEDVFEKDVGELVAFVPFERSATPGDRGGHGHGHGDGDGHGDGVAVGAAAGAVPGRADWYEVPGGEWAVLLHTGTHDDLDTAYAEAGSFVASRAIGVTGAIREDFLVSRLQTPDPDAWRTEVWWPVFRTAASA